MNRRLKRVIDHFSDDHFSAFLRDVKLKMGKMSGQMLGEVVIGEVVRVHQWYLQQLLHRIGA